MALPPRPRRSHTAFAVVSTALLLTACAASPASPAQASASANQASASPSAGPSNPSTPSPATARPTATPQGSPAAIVVTIRVAGTEEYRIELTDPADIEIARQLLADDEVLATIPNGAIVRNDPSVNNGYSWHIDPGSFEWAEVTTEVCDGLPSYVEDGTLSGPRFCPWQAEVIAIQPAP